MTESKHKIDTCGVDAATPPTQNKKSADRSLEDSEAKTETD